MALEYGFFNAQIGSDGEYDRVYNAEQFAEYFHLFVANGVFANPSTQLQVISDIPASMNVLVSDGFGWINGYYVKNSGEYPIKISVANAALPRIDAVVLRWVNASRSMELAVKTGVASASPRAPSLTRSEDVYELMLATVRVDAGATNIPQSAITDKRADSSVCGWVTGAVQNIDTTNLFAQYDDAFHTWFSDLQNQLSGNVATNLQNQINTLKDEKVNISDKAITTQAQGGTDDAKWMTPLKTLDAIKKRRWNLLASYKTAQSFTFTVPSNIYELGVVVMGGGASGGCGARKDAIGGAGGKVKQFTMTVTPGQKITGVVGAGGAKRDWTSSGNGSVVGYDGGASSFNGVTAEGGTSTEGGQGPTISQGVGAAGGVIGTRYGTSQPSGQLMNFFEPGKVLSASGGYPPTGSYDYGTNAGGVSDYGSGGTGRSADRTATRDTTADSATGNGCGGGGAYNYNYLGNSIGDCHLISGAGSPGMVLIYGR